MTDKTQGNLRASLEQVENLLTNMQPHIEQACFPGRATFIDSYVDAALEIVRAELSATSQPTGEPQAQPEPVAWRVYIPSQQRQDFYDDADDTQLVDDMTNCPDAELTPLYAAPPIQAEAQVDAEEVTEEMIDAACEASPDLWREDAKLVIEAALAARAKEKT